MSHLPSKPFELRGEFAGFIRTVQGKRRMVLRTDGEEHLLKVPKELRHQLTTSLAPGTKVAVTGDEVVEEGEHAPKRVVSQVQRLTSSGEAVIIHCPIRVCSKKNCWRSGGKELWHALEASLARRGLSDSVPLETVDCMDHCKRAPNAEWEGREFLRCSLEDAEKIVDLVQARDRERSAHD
jgi:predicted metal-binding protein